MAPWWCYCSFHTRLRITAAPHAWSYACRN